MPKSEAWLNGWLAHKNHQEGDENPYDQVKQARSYAQWDAGWCARFSAWKHGHDLTHDDVEFND